MDDPHLWYDKYGQPLSGVLAWGKLHRDREYSVVAQTKLWHGALVSTVWLGIDHGWGEGPPVIFETMVFPTWRGGELDWERYSTLHEAVAGHIVMVNRWKNQFLISWFHSPLQKCYWWWWDRKRAVQSVVQRFKKFLAFTLGRIK